MPFSSQRVHLKSKTSITKLMSFLGACAACVFAIAIPSIYSAVAINGAQLAITIEAAFLAKSIEKIIQTRPDLWEFESVRLIEIISQTSAHGKRHEKEIRTAGGKLVTKNDFTEAGPIISVSAQFFDSGRLAGSIIVRHSIRRQMITAALLGILSSLLGYLIYFIFRTYPMRILERTFEALQESEAKYYDLYKNAPDIYYSIDMGTGTIQECNETFVRTTGFSREEIVGRPVFDLYYSDSVEDAKQSFQQFTATGEVRNAERRVQCKDGRIIDVILNVSAVRDKDGKILLSRSSWHDITERKKFEEIIHNLSMTDQLTGLYNRRGLLTLAEQQLRIAERTKNSLLLLFADLDDLKKINDKLGHDAGDEALIETADILKEVFRKVDIIARIGGDEFAVLASEASLEYSAIINNRLQEQFAIHSARDNRAFTISISVGIAYYDPEQPCSLDELISRADSLMYEQKMSKRTKIS